MKCVASTQILLGLYLYPGFPLAPLGEVLSMGGLGGLGGLSDEAFLFLGGRDFG